jgi:hypothetical protein
MKPPLNHGECRRLCPEVERVMLSFAQFLADAARKGEAVNTLFEERLFDLVGILHKITDPLMVEGVSHELVGGLAVLVHVEEADPAQSVLTRDVDLMIQRCDLETVKEIAAQHGFRFRHAAGVDMLLHGISDRARNAVHLIFSGEKVRPDQTAPNPPIRPERKSIHGREVFVISVPDLVKMKLISYRDKDRVHIRSMDAAGLITPAVERGLPRELQSRLRHIRQTE